jgi:hypothetical protein
MIPRKLKSKTPHLSPVQGTTLKYTSTAIAKPSALATITQHRPMRTWISTPRDATVDAAATITRSAVANRSGVVAVECCRTYSGENWSEATNAAGVRSLNTDRRRTVCRNTACTYKLRAP